MKTLKNLTIYTEDGIIKNAYIKFEKQILEIGKGDIEGIDMKGKILIPGFIEQHLHGGYGADVMDASLEAIETLVKNLPKEGITSFYPTTTAASYDEIIDVLTNIKNYKDLNFEIIGADIAGIHLEGPFLNEKFKGAQKVETFVNPDVKTFNSYNKASGNLIKHVTLAPEVNGGLDLIKHLVKNKIVASIGHTNATDVEAESAIKLGATHFTHAFNAMSMLHHRNIGAVGTMLLNDDAIAEVISDEIHVSPKAIKLLYKSKSYKNLILITDSMRAKGLSDGEYELGGQNVIVKDNQARLKDGTLAGSTLAYDQGVKNFKKINNCSIEQIIQLTAINPAKIHHIFDKKGSIKVGKDADFIITNENLDIIETYCRGTKF